MSVSKNNLGTESNKSTPCLEHQQNSLAGPLAGPQMATLALKVLTTAQSELTFALEESSLTLTTKPVFSQVLIFLEQTLRLCPGSMSIKLDLPLVSTLVITFMSHVTCFNVLPKIMEFQFHLPPSFSPTGTDLGVTRTSLPKP
jgi:hypothetical protein